MKKGKLMLSSLLVGALLFTGSASCVFAAETESADLTKTYTDFKWQDSGKYDVPKRIKENGKTYKLTGYEVLDNVEVTKKETVMKKNELKAPKTAAYKSISGDMLQLELKDITWKENKVVLTQEYKTFDEVPEEIEEEVEIKKGSDKKEMMILKLAGTEDKSRVDDFSASAKFYANYPDTKKFEFNGKVVTTGTDAPTWDGYKADVKEYLGLNGNIYDITGGQWTSDFKEDGDVFVRTATFTGTKQVNLIEAKFKASVYEAQMLYSGLDPAVNVDIFASYDRAIGTKEVIMIGAGVVILAIAAAAILFIIRRKRESEE